MGYFFTDECPEECSEGTYLWECPVDCLEEILRGRLFSLGMFGVEDVRDGCPAVRMPCRGLQIYTRSSYDLGHRG